MIARTSDWQTGPGSPSKAPTGSSKWSGVQPDGLPYRERRKHRHKSRSASPPMSGSTRRRSQPGKARPSPSLPAKRSRNGSPPPGSPWPRHGLPDSSPDCSTSGYERCCAVGTGAVTGVARRPLTLVAERSTLHGIQCSIPPDGASRRPSAGQPTMSGTAAFTGRSWVRLLGLGELLPCGLAGHSEGWGDQSVLGRTPRTTR